ncbi:MAG: hypothetical protein HQL52_13285 [Magnetococcales bacterium]|nr:hypothetical protein [Magnetococcales bacterium]
MSALAKRKRRLPTFSDSDILSYAELVAREAPKRSGFLPYQADGKLHRPAPPKKPPAIPPEVLEKKRLEKLEKEVYQKAFAAGEKAGLALGEQKMQQEMDLLLPQLQSILDELETLPGRVFAASERFMVETAIVLVRELVAHELSLEPERINARIQRLLTQVANRREVVVHLAPHLAELMGNLNGFENLRFEANPTVPPGSVRVESDFGGVEDNLGSRLQEMESGMRAALVDRLEEQGYRGMVTGEIGTPTDEAVAHLESVADQAALDAKEALTVEARAAEEARLAEEAAEAQADEAPMVEEAAEAPMAEATAEAPMVQEAQTIQESAEEQMDVDASVNGEASPDRVEEVMESDPPQPLEEPREREASPVDQEAMTDDSPERSPMAAESRMSEEASAGMAANARDEPSQQDSGWGETTAETESGFNMSDLPENPSESP